MMSEKAIPFTAKFAVYLVWSQCFKTENHQRRKQGRLREVVRLDNFSLVIPSALILDDAFAYLRGLYVGYDGVFTAYYVVPLEA